MTNTAEKPTAPAQGYYLPLWQMGNRYRATALAYLKQEYGAEVANSNGFTYSKEELEKEINRYNPQP